MKNIKIICLLALIGLWISCNKEEGTPISPPPPEPIYVPIFEPGDTTKGVAYANKLTASWAATFYCKTAYLDSSMLGLKLYTYDSNGNRRESINLGTISKYRVGFYGFATDIYHIPDGAIFTSYATWISDGDVLEDYYLVDSTDLKNRLTITKIDLANKRIEGKFHASYNIQEPRINPLNPKKVTFSAGRFWATIRD